MVGVVETAVVGVAIKYAVNRISNLLMEKGDFLLGVDQQLTLLKTELEMMKSFMQDASKKQVSDERVRTWISNVQHLTQDTTNIIESFARREDARGWLGICACIPVRRVNHLYKLGQDIEQVNRRLNQLRQMRDTYGIQPLDDETGPSKKAIEVSRQRQVLPWHAEKHVVGIEGDVDMLLKKSILLEKGGLSIATIIGMGGLGKSTLAKKVYNHEAVVAQFECRVWITVSQDFRPKEVMMTMMMQLLGPDEDKIKVRKIMKESSEEEVMEMVNKRLTNKQYLVVVDDLWQQQHLDYLEKVFPNHQDKASRLLITSRIKDVAINPEYAHHLKRLDSEKSWQLFLKATLNDDTCPPNMKSSVGEEMLRICDGLPLAIIVMGGMLSKQNWQTWRKIRKEIALHFSVIKDRVMTVLELSYQDLPSNLQSCFLYLSFLREDENIYAPTLVKMWIAEGIVPDEGGQTMEERGMSYLGELINRNMIQATDVYLHGYAKYCQIHDLVLELSVSKAKEVLKFDIIRGGNSSSGELAKARHLAFYGSSEEFMSFKCPNKDVCSLFFYESDIADKTFTYEYWESLQGLTTLNLTGLGLEDVSEKIGTMIRLRCLNLSWNKIRRLPKSLGNLKKLQTLDISKNDGVIVPNVLWKLDSLRHLHMSFDINPTEPLQLNTLKNLQTIHGISIKNVVFKKLEELINLRNLLLELEPTQDVDVSKLFSLLGALENVVSLCLVWKSGCISLDGIADLKKVIKLRINGPLENLRTNCPEALLDLRLGNIQLKEDPMPVLGLLPMLLHLDLYQNVCSCEEMEIRDDGFRSLISLHLRLLRVPRMIHIGNNAMIKLEELGIFYCPNLMFIPQKEELRLMANLQELKVYGTSKENISKLKTDEYSSTISKIPSVQIVVAMDGNFHDKISKQKFIPRPATYMYYSNPPFDLRWAKGSTGTDRLPLRL